MEVALIEYFPDLGFEVWITDLIEIGEGMGDVFSTREEALEYVRDHNVPLVDISHFSMPFLEGEALRSFLGQFLELSSDGAILAIRKTVEN